MARSLLILVLCCSVATPALAARWYHPVQRSARCKIVNIAPYYTQTTIRNGKRVYLTREKFRRDMAIICNEPRYPEW